LGGLLLFTAVVAYACKYVLDVVRLHADQYDTIADLTYSRDNFVRLIRGSPGSSFGTAGRGGGNIQGGFEAPNGWMKNAADWLGIKYEVDVVSVSLGYDRPDWGEDLEVMRRLPKLRHLCLHHCEVTEEMIEALKAMHWLEKLRFDSTDITAEAAHALKLAMPNTHITVTHTEQRPSTEYRVDPFSGKREPVPGQSIGITDLDLP
jgi:hypothetical protein